MHVPGQARAGRWRAATKNTQRCSIAPRPCLFCMPSRGNPRRGQPRCRLRQSGKARPRWRVARRVGVYAGATRKSRWRLRQSDKEVALASAPSASDAVRPLARWGSTRAGGPPHRRPAVGFPSVAARGMRWMASATRLRTRPARAACSDTRGSAASRSPRRCGWTCCRSPSRPRCPRCRDRRSRPCASPRGRSPRSCRGAR